MMCPQILQKLNKKYIEYSKKKVTVNKHSIHMISFSFDLKLVTFLVLPQPGQVKLFSSETPEIIFDKDEKFGLNFSSQTSIELRISNIFGYFSDISDTLL